MDYIWIAIAFVCGFVVKKINLPPLVGYLTAGFGLHAVGVEPDASLNTLSEIGIALLLFTIGLKLDIKNLFRVEIITAAIGNMSAIVVLTMLNCLLLAALSFSYFNQLDWTAAIVLGFAASFSSTVFVVKVL